MVEKSKKTLMIAGELIKELQKDSDFRKISIQQDLSKQVGAEIAAVRKKRQMSQPDFAKRIGKSDKVVSRIERGEYKQYTVSLLLEIARVLKCKLTIHLQEEK